MKKRVYPIIGFIVVATIIFSACASADPGPTPTDEPGNPAIITDRTGRSWDVTHARDTYGMNPDYFNYGLGVGAISSVDNPILFREGDPGYPDPESNILVFGVNRNGERRAYSVSALTRHEVFNDVYPGESDRYLVVTY